MEKWRSIKGYEGLYQVSDEGKIKSFKKWNGHRYVRETVIIKGWVNTHKGYKRHMVGLTKDKVVEEFRVSRLVAINFIPNPNGKPEVNHIDGDSLNNHIDNLEWVTSKENSVHALETGLIEVPAYERKEEVVERYKNGESIRSISKDIGSNDSTVRKVLKRNEIEIRNPGFYQNKYNIDRHELTKDFESGMRNVDIAKKHNTNRHLVATYKYKHKKGELV